MIAAIDIDLFIIHPTIEYRASVSRHNPAKITTRAVTIAHL